MKANLQLGEIKKNIKGTTIKTTSHRQSVVTHTSVTIGALWSNYSKFIKKEDT
jgi:hypothetical protein